MNPSYLLHVVSVSPQELCGYGLCPLYQLLYPQFLQQGLEVSKHRSWRTIRQRWVVVSKKKHSWGHRVTWELSYIGWKRFYEKATFQWDLSEREMKICVRTVLPERQSSELWPEGSKEGGETDGQEVRRTVSSLSMLLALGRTRGWLKAFTMLRADQDVTWLVFQEKHQLL